MEGTERLQPSPKGPLPAPESYVSVSCGPKPDRPGLVKMGTVIDPVPVTGLAANFSPMPRIAPPPFGSDTAGGCGGPPTSWLRFCASPQPAAAASAEFCTNAPALLV